MRTCTVASFALALLVSPTPNAGLSSMVSEMPPAAPLVAGTDEQFWPSWSPDGTEVLFAAKDSAGTWDIHVVRADGSGRRVLGPSPATDKHPRWSASGDVVFDSDRHGEDDVFIIARDGSGPRRLTSGDGVEGAGVPSPDGRRVAYLANTGGTWLLHTVDIDGAGDRRLVDGTVSVFGHAWAPDGRSIVYTLSRPGDLYEVGLDGSPPRPLVATAEMESGARWSPDGSRLLFTRGSGASRNLFLLDRTGGVERRLTALDGGVEWTQWCPDGERVVFAHGPEGAEDVHVVRVRDGVVRRLTDHPGRDVAPSCDARGRVVFASERSGVMRLWMLTMDPA